MEKDIFSGAAAIIIATLILGVMCLSLVPAIAMAAEPCTGDNVSECDVQDGSLTLNPLETDAFLSEAENKVCIVYFYSDSCSHCKAIKPFIDGLENEFSDSVRLSRYEVSSPENLQLYNQLCSLRDYNGNSIPLIGINDRILVGENEIRDNLRQEIERGMLMEKKLCPLGDESGCHLTNATGGNKSANSSAEPPVPGLNDLKFWTVLPIIAVAGLGDGVNPCAFVILIFIMVFLQQISGNRKRLLKVTLTYVITLFIANVLIGVLYYYLSINLGFPNVIRWIVIVIALAAGLINIKDFFWYGKGVSLGIPKMAKGYLMSLVHLASVPAAFVLGASVAVLEAPCSIPIYLSVIEVLKGAGRSLGQVFPYIIIYNLMFILPLIVLAVAVYLGRDAKLFEDKSLPAKRYMKLVIGIILILLALAFIFGWL